ncbi:MAG: type II secretion system protein [Verrucomicrobia bacterium]|nr:type II secretion system protein [Verrucomicrobiota bacterium]
MRLPPRAKSRARAFTLVEVAVAAGVMALGLVGMIQVIVSGSQMLDVARKQNIAMQVIHGQIDQVRLRTWSEILALPASDTVRVDASDYGGDQTVNVSKGFVFGPNLPMVCSGFRCKREVADISGRADFKQITFTVTWTGNTGRPYSRSGTTYVGKNGLYVTYQRS